MPSPLREMEKDESSISASAAAAVAGAPSSATPASDAVQAQLLSGDDEGTSQRQQLEQEAPPSPTAAGVAAASSLDNNNKYSSNGGWLMTSCDADTTGDGPQTSLSEELKRLQLIRTYHAKDAERDASLDRFTNMACRVFQTPVALIAFLDMGRLMFRCNPDAPPDHQAHVSRTLRSCSQALQQHSPDVFVIDDAALKAAVAPIVGIKTAAAKDTGSTSIDTNQQEEPVNASGNDNTSNPENSNNTPYKTSNPKPASLQYRFLAGAPLISPEGCRLGAFCILDREPRQDGLNNAELLSNLADYAQLALKTIVDRRRTTTQSNPSHLVACTAHDLITPLTGIQLSLSLLQQDTEFQQKLGDEQTKSIAAAVRSSNMMLRICQSTIETLRGNRNISIGNHWTIPRNLIQPQSSPFVDLKDFVKNLESISSSISKRVPLTIAIDPAAPVSVVTDGLKIFRSALNLLSNACSNTRQGYIKFRIFDSGQRTLVFECEDTGKNIETKSSESLFQQDGESSDLGLYSLACQIAWLGGKYGYRPRCPRSSSSRVSGDAAVATKVPEKPIRDNDKPAESTNTLKENDDNNEKNQGSIFWFSIPLVLPQDVSDLMGLATQYTETNDAEKTASMKEEMPLTPPTTPLADEYQTTSSVPTLEGGTAKESQSAAMAVGAAAAASIQDQKPKHESRLIRALIIEDSSVIRKILGKALSNYGYEVTQAVNGMEGLEELKKTMFDMVLCDFLMPVMDGLDCVSQYREWEKRSRPYFHQHIVGISAHANQKDIDRGLEIGMDDFKPKPILPKMLAQLHESPALQRVRATLDNLASNTQRQQLRRRRQPSVSEMSVEDPISLVSNNSFHKQHSSPNNIVVGGNADNGDRPSKRAKLKEEIENQVRKAAETSKDG